MPTVNMIGIKADFGREVVQDFYRLAVPQTLFKDSKIKSELDFYKQSHLVQLCFPNKYHLQIVYNSQLAIKYLFLLLLDK